MSKYSVRWVERAEQINPSLWDRCFPPDVEGRWWYEALEKSHLESQFKFAYAVLISDEETNKGNADASNADAREIGIAPTFLMDVPIELVAPPMMAKVIRQFAPVLPSLQYQRTLFVGSPCAEEGTIGLLPGIQLHQVASVLQVELERRAAKFKAPMIVWKDLPEAYRTELQNVRQQRHLFELVSYPGTKVEVPDCRKETYFANLKPSRRHNLKKKLKKSSSNFAALVQVEHRPTEATLDEIFPLFWQTYEKGTTKFEQLNREYFSHIADNDQSHFVMLRDDKTNKLAAFMLCFALDQRVVNKFIGIDYSLPAEFYTYFRLYDVALDWVLARGVKEFQSGQTGYRAKIDVGNSLVPLTNYCKHRNPIINKVYAHLARDVSWESLDDNLAEYLKAHPDPRGTHSEKQAESLQRGLSNKQNKLCLYMRGAEGDMLSLSRNQGVKCASFWSKTMKSFLTALRKRCVWLVTQSTTSARG